MPMKKLERKNVVSGPKDCNGLLNTLKKNFERRVM
jgi:hypothetical protein